MLSVAQVSPTGYFNINYTHKHTQIKTPRTPVTKIAQQSAF